MSAARGNAPSNPDDAPRQGAAAAPRARCVVVHRPGSSVPRALADALARQQLDHVAMDAPVLALAELCITGRTGGRPAILLLDEPERLDDPVRLVRAARKYAGRAVCWQYRAAAHPQLSAVLDRDLDAWARAARPEPQSQLQPQPESKPEPTPPREPDQQPEPEPDPKPGVSTLRLTRSDADLAAEPAPRHAGESPQRLLTGEELSMLFNGSGPGSRSGSGPAPEGRDP